MAVKWIVTTSLYVKVMFCLLHNSDDGVTIEYSVTFGNVCWSEEGRFSILLGMSLGQCVQECGLRKHCKALNFQRRLNVCELFSKDTDADVNKAECIRVLSKDIEIIQKPCNDCVYGKVCDTTTKTCMLKECVSLNPLNNGRILGNMRIVGSKIRFMCNDGYSLRNGIRVAECTTAGTWNATAECVIDTPCGGLPSVPNGTAVLATVDVIKNLYTANVICDLWYQTRKTVITCTNTGDWENAVCADCYLTTPKDYLGKKNHTEDGLPCMNWEEMDEHGYHNISLLPDEPASEAKNYCRNPYHAVWNPWCYINSNHDWGLCGIEACV